MSKVAFNVTMKSNEDATLAELAKELGLSENAVDTFDDSVKLNYQRYMKILEEDKNASTDKQEAIAAETIAAIVGIVIAACEAIQLAYKAGRYAAKQCQVRLGLTSAIYKANKWQIRAAIVAAALPAGILGASVFVGFDDYFMGV